jgi:hypothetical protein
MLAADLRSKSEIIAAHETVLRAQAQTIRAHEEQVRELQEEAKAQQQVLAADRSRVAELETLLKNKTRALAAVTTEISRLAAARAKDTAVPLAESAATGNAGRQLVSLGGAQEIRYPLFKNDLTVGRGVDCDITVDSEHVSRRHAHIVSRDAGLFIEDLGSTNGTFVNGKLIEKSPLKPGDIVAFGKRKFLLVAKHRKSH